MKPIYDFCIFNNEFGILDLRLEYMQTFVEKFYVCEANLTHQGAPKKYLLDQFINSSELGRKLAAVGRLICVSLDIASACGEGLMHKYHRKAFHSWVSRNVADEYIGIFADCDELVREEFREVADGIKEIVSLDMQMFYFAADNLSYRQKWDLYVKAFPSEVLAEVDFEDLRVMRADRVITDMGWHFSSFGGVEQVRDKIMSISHPEFNNSRYNTVEIIESRLQNREDYLGRSEFPCQRFDLSDFPDRMQELLLKRPEFLLIDNLLKT